LLQRQQRLQQLQHFQYERIAQAVHRGLSPPLDDCGKRLLALFLPLAAEIAGQLAAAARIALPLQPAIRDVWHDHVLFTGDEVSGLVDFGALRIDTPLADVARLVGSLAGDDLPARDHALAAYHALRPLSDQDRTLIDLLDRSGVLLAGFSWLEWLYLDRRTFDDLPAITRRLETILLRLAVGSGQQAAGSRQQAAGSRQ
jgi:homoserine kinase type II